MPANSEFFDAQLRHQIGLQRLAAGDVKRVQAILKKADAELTAVLKDRLKPDDFTSQRYKRMLADVKAMRREALRQVGKASTADLRSLAKAEQVFMKDMMEGSVPVRLDFATADANKLASAVTQNPFTAGTTGAKTLNQWWTGLAAADANRIVGAIQLGLVQGETVGQMVKRVVDATDMTRRNAEAVVRTGVNHVSNSSRGEFFKANKDVMNSLMWSAMLDGRTTIICASRDGHHAPVDGSSWDNVPTPHLDSPNDRPPAHVQCRSFMVGVLDAYGVAQKMPNRAFVRDKRTRRFRERDFRRDAKTKVGAKNWKAMTTKERNAAIAGERKAWAKANIGQAPGKINYEQWLKKQPTKFQDQVLGKAKAAEFRNGAKLSKFVDKRGNELTLDQLKKGGGSGGTPTAKPAVQKPVQKQKPVKFESHDYPIDVESTDALHKAMFESQSGLAGDDLALNAYVTGREEMMYKGVGHRAINGYLRGTGDALSKAKQTRVVRAIDSLSKTFRDPKAVLDRNVTLYREMAFKSTSELERAFGGVLKPGVTYSDPGIISTSLNGNASHAAGSMLHPGEYPVSVHIRAAKGARGIVARVDQMHLIQQEVVLPPGQNFRVVSVERIEGSSGKVSFKGDYAGPRDYAKAPPRFEIVNVTRGTWVVKPYTKIVVEMI